TAPMNSAVSFSEELSRLKDILASFQNDALSIDTYKSETIKVMLELRKELVWNDVSGQLDSELQDVLEEHKHIQTIYCHNLCSERSKTSKHMDFVSDQDVMLSLESRFTAALEWFDKYGFKTPILDFCFGFSKTLDQNWQILKAMPEFIHEFERKNGAQDWILAISRKSFFKQLARTDSFQAVTIQTEYMQGQYLMWLSDRLNPSVKMTVRLHDPSLAHAFTQLGNKL